MHIVNRISHRMQKYNFGVMGPDVLFIESELVLPKHQK
jgi:hypothetical protein